MLVHDHVLSKILDIRSRTQIRPFTVYPRYASSIGHVDATHSSRHSISHHDIVMPRPAFKDTKAFPHRTCFSSGTCRPSIPPCCGSSPPAHRRTSAKEKVCPADQKVLKSGDANRRRESLAGLWDMSDAWKESLCLLRTVISVKSGRCRGNDFSGG
jgi:hypothetical protein